MHLRRSGLDYVMGDIQKIVHERKYKIQRNKVNNLKKSAKENFYVSINESLSELKNTNFKQYWKTMRSRIRISFLISDVIHILSLGLMVTLLVCIHSCAICMNCITTLCVFL
jgi:hypothetical protein